MADAADTGLIALPAGRVAATPALVQTLIAQQFPRWRHLPIRPVARQGWDNRSFRLGDRLLLRMPTARHYAAHIEIERHWLPVLAARLPLAIPQPIAIGTATTAFPFPWLVCRWLVGTPVDQASGLDQRLFADDLAGFLRALWAVPATDGPEPGPANFHRGGDLAAYDAQTRNAVAKLGSHVAGDAALGLWEAALAAPWTGRPVWLHGDIAPANMLTRSGRLSAIIDFGQCAVGDPACDLAIAWRWFDPPARHQFLQACALDEASVRRGAAWALWKALIELADLPGVNPAGRTEAARVIDTILADAISA
jgi:aminoglycoside phosphotransferase (APT) family kinase protein